MGGVISTEGDDWPLNWPKIISGHIHDYDELQCNILYPGTPIQHAFGDRDDKTISWIEWNQDERTDERINLNLPRKAIIHLTCKEAMTYILPQEYANSKVKMILTGTGPEVKTTMKLQSLRNWMKEGVKVVYKTIPNERQRTEGARVFMRYYERLYRSAQQRPEMLKVYRKIFGGDAEGTQQKVRLRILEPTNQT